MSDFIFDPTTNKYSSAFTVNVTSNIKRAEALLRSIPGGAETAQDKAIMAVRRQHSRFAEEALKKQYNVTSALLHKKDGKHARITPKYKKTSAPGHGSINEILYSTHRIPLAEFMRNPQDQRAGVARPIWKKLYGAAGPDLYHFRAGVEPKVHVRKDTQSEKVTRSFVARVHAGKSEFHTGIFERAEKRASLITVQTANGLRKAIDGSSKIEQKYGPSVSEMLDHSDKVREEIDAAMQQSMNAVLDDKIRLILEGKLAV